MHLKSLCATAVVAILATACKTGDVCATYYRDRDGDGFGDSERSRFTCGQPNNYVTNDRDCDDRDETIAPTGTFEGNLTIDGEDEGELQAFIDACPGNVAGNITIINTPRENVSFLRTLASVEGTLTLSNNKDLADLSGLQNITDVGGLVLAITPGLRDLDDIENLERATTLRLSVRLTSEENDLTTLSDIEGIQDLAINVIGVNNFLGLPKLTDLTGDLLIGGPSINSLEGLETIRSVGGSLTITNFSNPVGFEALGITNVGGTLRITDNEGSTEVALPAITSIGALDVRNNGSLGTLDLSNITTVGRISFNSNAVLDTITTGFTTATDIDFTNMPALTSLTGFSDIEDAMLDGLIVRNSGVTSLVGLEGATEVVGSVQIVGNADLPSMAGLDGLTDVGGLFQIVNNASLTALTGLGSLETAVVGFEVTTNDRLTSFAGLDAIDTVGSLTVSDNAALSSFDGIDTLTTVDTILVEGNAVLTSIDGLNNISGANSVTFRSNTNLQQSTIDDWVATVGAKNLPNVIVE